MWAFLCNFAFAMSIKEPTYKRYRLAKGLLAALLLVVATAVFAEGPEGSNNSDVEPLPASQDSDSAVTPLDSLMNEVEISLITCGPHDMVYALYGHTGIRIHNKATGDDMLANWGIFDQSQSFFVVRFAFGLTDYRMEIESWKEFVARYNYFNCRIKEQVLDLTSVEKNRIMSAVFQNYLPENRYYRYNFYYDNCTTRARDLIESNLEAPLYYPSSEKEPDTTYREEIHKWNWQHLWARWGNDFLLGVGSDKKIDYRQKQFLPDNLYKDFEEALITRDGKQCHIVKGENIVNPEIPDYEEIEALALDESSWIDFFNQPHMLFLVLFVVFMVIELIERKKLNRRIWQFDALLLLSTGICGLVLFLMIFSQHPTVSFNLQILIFNPLALVFLVPIIRKLRRGERSKLRIILALCYGVSFIYFFIYQKECAEAVQLLALTLLSRMLDNYGLEKKS